MDVLLSERSAEALINLIEAFMEYGIASHLETWHDCEVSHEERKKADKAIVDFVATLKNIG